MKAASGGHVDVVDLLLSHMINAVDEVSNYPVRAKRAQGVE